MTSSTPAPHGKPDKSEEFDPFQTAREYRQGWLQRRRAKVAAEIDRNRRGDYRVPTWVFAAALAAIVVFWAAIMLTS